VEVCAANRGGVDLDHDVEVVVEVASTMPDPLIAELVALGMRPLAPGAGVDDIRLAYAKLGRWLSGSLRYLNYAAALPISAARSTSRLA
jgi:hypothetical protein